MMIQFWDYRVKSQTNSGSLNGFESVTGTFVTMINDWFWLLSILLGNKPSTAHHVSARL